MQNIKNIAVGFLVSFLGSIPLGYLNVIGFKIYSVHGLTQTLLYLLGVICIEFVVIYLTLISANKLSKNQKLLKFIDLFSIVFMFVLAYVFFSAGNSEAENYTLLKEENRNYFFTGIVLSCFNFIQIPFWLSWNLYLLNGKYIEISNSRKYFYVLGTIAGTFVGMLALILMLHSFTANFEFLSRYLMLLIIPLVFVGLGIFQAVKFYRKYYS